MKRAKAFTFLLGSLLLGSGLAQQKGWWSSYDYSQVSSQVVTRGHDAPILRGRAVNWILTVRKSVLFTIPVT